PLDTHHIIVEITERTYAQHQDLFSKVIKELRNEGFRIAVDDLGSGYSNLSSLAEIEPEFLKFDHHFTKDIERHRIKQDLLGAILNFAVDTNTQVIAEGIETEQEFQALRRLGVPLGQGYYLARPGPIGAAAARRDLGTLVSDASAGPQRKRTPRAAGLVRPAKSRKSPPSWISTSAPRSQTTRSASAAGRRARERIAAA